MDEFDPGDYRRRVLAEVLGRGGPETSDPFELYDLPLSDDLDDAAVAGRVAEVWGSWQRQRDHPKYRVLVTELVAGHAARSAELLDAGRRRTAAARVRAQREQRDGARFALLDAAVSRLVDRHGGIPADKVEGLHDVGASTGLSRDEVTARLRRHRTRPASATPGVSPERRRQVRALLDEFGRLTDAPAPPTLLALLGLEPSASEQQVRVGAAAWRSRARELPPQRLRTVVDELLVHVAELVEPGRAAVEGYLDAVAADVTGYLRPRVRAAVLVEDRLVAEDHAHLLDEARALGLDDTRARAVLAAVAAELGADEVAVGTVYELPSVRGDDGTPGRTVLVMTPALAHDAVGVGDEVVLTVGSVAHVEELVRATAARATAATPARATPTRASVRPAAGRPTRVVVKLASSMQRYGVTRTTVDEVVTAAERAGLTVHAYGLHLPLVEAGIDAVGEIEAWLPVLPSHATVHVSHLGPTALAALAGRHPSHRFRLRMGTALWHGDKSAFRLEADVVDVRRVRAGDTAGYRLTPVPADGHLVLVGAGTSHGVQPLPDGRSPFHFQRQRLALLEPPHMHTSMAFVPAGAPLPGVGDEVDVQRPLTQTWPDRVVER